jgi:hypothetical protein
MAITPLTSPPSPANSNAERGMTVWINGSAGNANDPLKSDSTIQSLINFCGNNGVNVVFLDIYPYIGGGNWSSSNATQLARAVHYLRTSYIKVIAMAGNNDWGHNQQWVAKNILKAIQQYDQWCDQSSNSMSHFDGLAYDVEYWTVTGYGSTEPIGLCDLMNASRALLNIPVGCFATQWLADGTSAALTITYNGVTQLEGLCLMDNSDFVVVMDYFATSSQQISQFSNWFNYASTTGAKKNIGLYCGAETTSGVTGSYWTGSSGAKSAMETAQTSVSSQFTAAPNTNMSFLGASIDPYYSPTGPSGWSQMT